MKRLLLISASVLALASCAKEMTVETPAVPMLKALISADSEYAGKGEFNTETMYYCFSVGDSISFFEKDVAKDNNFTFKCTSAGSSASFSGEVPASIDATKTYYVYTPFLTNWAGSSSTAVTRTLDSVQSGKLEDFGKYNIAFGTTSGNKIEDGVFSCTAKLKNLCPVLKFTGIDAANKITRIRLETNDDGVKLSGQYTYKPKNSGANTIYTTTSGQNYVEVYRDGEIISGDVYIFLYSNGYSDGKYLNTVKKMTLTLTNTAGSTVSKDATLSTSPVAGEIKNLGSLGTVTFEKVKNPATPSFLDNVRPYVTMANIPEGTTFYYTMGNNESIAAPTEESPVIDTEKGIYFGGNDDGKTYDFNTTYIKVLAKNPECFDSEYTVFVRMWTFAPGFTATTDYASSGCNFTTGAGEFTTNGMKVSVTAAYSNFKASDTGWMVNSPVNFEFSPLKGGNGVIYARMKGNSSSGSRYINFYKDGVEIGKVDAPIKETHGYPVPCGEITTDTALKGIPGGGNGFIYYIGLLEYNW